MFCIPQLTKPFTKKMSICLHCTSKQINRNCMQEKDNDDDKERGEEEKSR